MGTLREDLIKERERVITIANELTVKGITDQNISQAIKEADIALELDEFVGMVAALIVLKRYR
jgi:hypothetical protein